MGTALLRHYSALIAFDSRSSSSRNIASMRFLISIVLIEPREGGEAAIASGGGRGEGVHVSAFCLLRRRVPRGGRRVRPRGGRLDQERGEY